MLDLLLRKACCSISWFPSFLEQVKAVVSWLRTEIYVETLKREWASRGLDAAIALLGAISLPTFAHWRWGTLNACCQVLGAALATIAQNWDPTRFRGGRDERQLTLVTTALRSQQ